MFFHLVPALLNESVILYKLLLPWHFQYLILELLTSLTFELTTDICLIPKRPKLSLGYIPVITQYKITNIIGLYNQNFSNVNLNLKESEHNDIINMLTKG